MSENDSQNGKFSQDLITKQEQFLDQIKDDGQSGDNLYRLAKICMFLSSSAETAQNKEFQKSMAMKALSLASKACKKEPDNSECHKWMCAAIVKLAKLSDAKEKMEYDLQFKQHSDISLRLNPNDTLMQTMYGQWCYDMASMSWVQKKLAETVCGHLPDANYDMAVNAFLKVKELNPESKENHLWLAKVLIAKNQIIEAKQYINSGLKLPNKTHNDQLFHKELTEINEQIRINLN